MNKEFNTNVSKEGLNKLVHNLLESTNNRYQCNIKENELREILDIKENEYLYTLTINYEWLKSEYDTDKFKDLSEALFNEWYHIYFE